MGKSICSKCEGEFKDEAGYLAHECAKTGFKPTDPAHQGKRFAKVQEAALARGKARKGSK